MNVPGLLRSHTCGTSTILLLVFYLTAPSVDKIVGPYSVDGTWVRCREHCFSDTD